MGEGSGLRLWIQDLGLRTWWLHACWGLERSRGRLACLIHRRSRRSRRRSSNSSKFRV